MMRTLSVPIYVMEENVAGGRRNNNNNNQAMINGDV
jgi:hypothetical protein